MKILKRLKKNYSQCGARIFGFWRGFGEGAGWKPPVTEPKRSQKPKRPLAHPSPHLSQPRGYRFSLNASISRFQTALLTPLLLSLPWFGGIAHAHDVWIEDLSDHRLVIHFGEFGDELETSPGYLDSLSLPQAWTKTAVTNPVPFEIEKQTNALLLAGSSASNFAAAETDFEVLSATNKPSRLPIFYARWQPADAGPGKPALTLDLVPDGKPGDIRLYFRGQPVPGETITAHGPADFEKELKTDADGRVHFTLEK